LGTKLPAIPASIQYKWPIDALLTLLKAQINKKSRILHLDRVYDIYDLTENVQNNHRQPYYGYYQHTPYSVLTYRYLQDPRADPSKPFQVLLHEHSQANPKLMHQSQGSQWTRGFKEMPLELHIEESGVSRKTRPLWGKGHGT
jgi:hypothetical protein